MKNDFVTKPHFDKTMKGIDTRFDSMDKKIDEKFGYLDEKIDTVLEAMHYGFEQNAIEHTEFKKVNQRLEGKIDSLINTVDSFVKHQITGDQEFAVLKHRVTKIEAKIGI